MTDTVALIQEAKALVKTHNEQIVSLKDLISQLRGTFKLPCARCKTEHKIADLTAVQTYWYTSPYGCTEGDYWTAGELQVLCPDCGAYNRLLFDNYDVPWEKRKEYSHNPEAQFRQSYKPLFQSVDDLYGDQSEPTVNNYFVDVNRVMFGLVEKRKPEPRGIGADYS